MEGGHGEYLHELGPETDADAIDPGNPAVITWVDGERFVLLASDAMEAADLLEIATSLYPAP